MYCTFYAFFASVKSYERNFLSSGLQKAVSGINSNKEPSLTPRRRPCMRRDDQQRLDDDSHHHQSSGVLLRILFPTLDSPQAS